MDIAAAGTWPAPGRGPAIRTGAIPPLAAGFAIRPETAPGLAAALVPGAAVALASASLPGRLAGSCGKTQLAVYFARTMWRGGQAELLAWINASSRASVLSGYAEAAAAAGIEAGGPAEDAAARFTSWLAATTRPWLIVLDDLRDPADLDGLRPGGPAGTVLITTPDEKAITSWPGGAGALVLPVGAFSTREAMSYLAGRLAGDPDQRQGAIDLALALEGDPCALAHAAALITATGTWTCRDYQRHYATRREHLTARHPAAGPPAPAAVTWALSAERAGQLTPGGAPQLQLALAALMDGQPIPGNVFTTPAAREYLTGAGTPADPDRAWQAVRTLEHAGLLAIDPAATPPAVRMPRQVAALARAEMPEQLLGRAARAAAAALLEIWPQPEPPLPWQAAGLRSCAAALQATAADRLWTAGACHPLLARAGHSTGAARLTGPAVTYWTQLAATSDRVLGPGHPHTLTAGTHLARALTTSGQAHEAAGWWRRAAAGRTRAFGPDHPDTLETRVSLGRAMTAAGQPSAAVTLLEQAAADCERALGPGHPATFTARDELAAACQAAGQAAQAISHYQRNLAGRERLLGPRHPATATARGRLASAYLANGRIKDAIACYKKILTDRQRALGDHHLDTIAARRDLATAYHKAGQIAAALQHHDQACAGYEHLLGADHPDTLACRAGQASTYLTAGRLTDATTLLRETLTRCEQALPAAHPLTQTVRQAMASITTGHTALCPQPGRPSC